MKFPACDRRRFIQSSSASGLALGIGSAIPKSFSSAAEAQGDDSTILVVIELTGGNDGLNTVIPYRNDQYRKLRPKLALPSADILTINDELGLHTSLSGMSELLNQGQLAILQGIGYENPNRSHFESMDIWHTCLRKDQLRVDGWIGRALERMESQTSNDVPAMHLGSKQQPFALASKSLPVPTVEKIDEFELAGHDPASIRKLLAGAKESPSELTVQSQTEEDDLMQFLRSSTAGALAASERITKVAMQQRSATGYPKSQLGEKLGVVAKLIKAGINTRVYYLQLDGFDTHAEQPETHSILLRQWSDAVARFMGDMESHGHLDRVCVMTFSEFGRRVAENASQGTDHGAAGPMFLCGGSTKPGLIGPHPSLTNLDQGDLRYHTDFRSVYAAVLENWLGVDSHAILGNRFTPVDVFG